MAETSLSMFVITTSGTIINIKKGDPLARQEYFTSCHATAIRRIIFPKY